MDFLSEHWLDLLTTVLGLLYVWLEYRASIALWLVGIVMPALDVYLFWIHGLYGDAGMAMYYTVAALYGLCIWKFKKTKELKLDLPIIHVPKRKYLPMTITFFLTWGLIYYVLITWTNSTVPVLDAFTNALSFVGLWALARKYLEQWLFWIVVDVVCCYLYITKGIPFKAGLYGLYVVIAVMGYFNWKKMMKEGRSESFSV